jgi:hypothetical protein
VNNLRVLVNQLGADLLKYALGDNERSLERSGAFSAFLFDAQQHVFETLRSLYSNQLTMECEICRSFWIAKLIPRSATIISPSFANADITQRIVENKSLRVENLSLSTEEVRYLALKDHVNTCKENPFVTVNALPIEGKQTYQWCRRTQEGHSCRHRISVGVYSANFTSFVSRKTGEVVAGKILARVDELWTGPIFTKTMAGACSSGASGSGVNSSTSPSVFSQVTGR